MELNNPLVLIGVVAGLAILLGGINALIGGPASVPASLVIDKTGFALAPELKGISGYINAEDDFTLASLKGKVVIVDFWTYSCINCIRTQPYLNAWHEKYADQGLVIVGVHTPEFSFEKEYENVLLATQDAGIQYPVVLDNDYATWRAYANRYWPRKYLIDAEGYIRYDHIGEGGYDETEEWIQKLLSEKDALLAFDDSLSADEVNAAAVDFSKIGTPEIYLGYSFARAPLGSPEGFQPEQTVEYSIPETVSPNLAALSGTWINTPDYMELSSEEGEVRLEYTAKNVNIVAANAATLDVYLDGEKISTIETNAEQLYSLITTPNYETHVLTFKVKGKGFQLYTFTFG